MELTIFLSLSVVAEIDALPDAMIGLSEMHEYGYTWNEMLPLAKETAMELFAHDLPMYLLHEDGSETMVEDRRQIAEHEGVWALKKVIGRMKEAYVQCRKNIQRMMPTRRHSSYMGTQINMVFTS